MRAQRFFAALFYGQIEAGIAFFGENGAAQPAESFRCGTYLK